MKRWLVCAVFALNTAWSGAGESLYLSAVRFRDDHGAERTLNEFRGEPVVLALFYTRCSGACPAIVSDLKRLQIDLGAESDNCRFVLISMDADFETPRSLHAYRQAAGLDARWTLLCGTSDAVREWAMLTGGAYTRQSSGQFMHSNLVTVLDRGGAIVFQRKGLTGETAALRAAVIHANARAVR